MLISDWSSDVCSSDLKASPRRAGRDGRARRAGAAVSSRYRDRRTSPRRYDCGGRRTGPALRARSLVPDQQSLRGRHWTTGRGWRLHFGQGIAESQDGPRRGAAEEHWWSGQGKAAPDLQLIRSEEHTSELQSLMRTSYAVFCLKKKKT